MKKTHKAGQLFTINGKLYQFKKATDGCKGCSLNEICLCLNIVDRRYSNDLLDCLYNGLILVKL